MANGDDGDRCGKDENFYGSSRPAWAKFGGFDGCAEFLDDFGQMPRSLPLVEGGLLPVELPFPCTRHVGSSFWSVYLPPLAAVNGLLDAEAEIAQASLVQCSVASLNNNITEEPRDKIRAQANVLKIVTLSDLLALPVEAAADIENVLVLPYVQSVGYAGWRYVSCDFEGVMRWGIWRKIGGIGHMLMTGYFNTDDAFVYGGHRLLTTPEQQLLDMPEEYTYSRNSYWEETFRGE